MKNREYHELRCRPVILVRRRHKVGWLDVDREWARSVREEIRENEKIIGNSGRGGRGKKIGQGQKVDFVP